METVNVNLAHRWYIGYDLTEAVPDHSSLSKIRERYGLTIFQQFFERIVELCRQAGLVWGEELYFDSTKVQANADIDRLIPRVEREAQQHLRQLFSAEAQTEEPVTRVTSSPATTLPSEPEVEPGLDSGVPLTAYELVAKYNGTPLTGVHTPSYVRLTIKKCVPRIPMPRRCTPRGWQCRHGLQRSLRRR